MSTPLKPSRRPARPCDPAFAALFFLLLALALIAGGCIRADHRQGLVPVAKGDRPKDGSPMPRDKPPMARPPDAVAVEASPPARLLRLFYATDRAATGNSNPANYYSSLPLPPGEPLNLGTCLVTIPPEHVIGRFEKPSFLRLEFHPDPEKHVTWEKSCVTNRPRTSGTICAGA